MATDSVARALALSASGGGGSDTFVVTFTCNSYKYVTASDKTYAEITAAILAGKNVVGYAYPSGEGERQIYHVDRWVFNSSSMYARVVFYSHSCQSSITGAPQLMYVEVVQNGDIYCNSFNPASTSFVSGTNDGTNWSTITIDGTTKAIPSGSGPSEYIKDASLTTLDNLTKLRLYNQNNAEVVSMRVANIPANPCATTETNYVLKAKPIGSNNVVSWNGSVTGASDIMYCQGEPVDGIDATVTATIDGTSVTFSVVSSGSYSWTDNSGQYFNPLWFFDGTTPHFFLQGASGTITSFTFTQASLTSNSCEWTKDVIPSAPASAGNYKLRCTVDSTGAATYSWVSDT